MDGPEASSEASSLKLSASMKLSSTLSSMSLRGFFFVAFGFAGAFAGLAAGFEAFGAALVAACTFVNYKQYKRQNPIYSRLSLALGRSLRTRSLRQTRRAQSFHPQRSSWRMSVVVVEELSMANATNARPTTTGLSHV